MLLRTIPLIAVTVTLIALLHSTLAFPQQKDGLFAPAHQVSWLF